MDLSWAEPRAVGLVLSHPPETGRLTGCDRVITDSTQLGTYSD